MFDISLGELAVIGAVALVVLGPEKLPKVARAAGMMLGRAQRMAADFRADLEKELHNSELSELGKQMAEEEAQIREQLSATTESVNHAIAEVENSHYGDGDPELDALEHRRYGGSEPEHGHDEVYHPYHDEVDPEHQIDDAVHESASEPVVSAQVAEPVSVSPVVVPVSKPEVPKQEAQLPLQPDLFAPSVIAQAENAWRDRR